MRLAYIQYVAQAECGFDDSVVQVETFAIADVDAAAVGTVVHKGAPHDRSRQRERHTTPDQTRPHHTTPLHHTSLAQSVSHSEGRESAESPAAEMGTARKGPNRPAVSVSLWQQQWPTDILRFGRHA